MKPRTLAAVLLLAIAASSAQAADKNKNDKKQPVDPAQAARQKFIDTAVKNFSKLDKDRDGSLDKKELPTAIKGLLPPLQGLVRQALGNNRVTLDQVWPDKNRPQPKTNADGDLSKEDFEQYVGELYDAASEATRVAGVQAAEVRRQYEVRQQAERLQRERDLQRQRDLREQQKARAQQKKK